MASTFPEDLKKLKKKIWDKEDTKSNQNLKEIDYKKATFNHTQSKLHNINKLYPRKTPHETRQKKLQTI